MRKKKDRIDVRAVRLVAAGTGGSGSVNILRQLLFVSLTQEAASARRVRTPRPAADADKTCGRDIICGSVGVSVCETNNNCLH
ncbi:hypothetical protein DY000_02027640 [Brassica cretica]|uniref:Uncharacterized protein n=1 Tax=Brassica cretica TaxID=69181 RepID=A0ABQ7ECL2_BRACR|nr:hypothetical protein DY000_02027640 [Brassica cretica]